MKAFLNILSTLLWVRDVWSIEVATHIPENIAGILNDSDTRRILHGWSVSEGRPYMVYLRLPRQAAKFEAYKTWLCGGVIVHEDYIITSAACIEDAKNFYIISGIYKYSAEDDMYNNQCIKNGAKKAVWKCVPKNYVFDGHENDNIRWMNNDIAVVKIEDGFDFERRIRGCQFIPKPIAYNNQSATLENPGNIGWVAGWGSTLKYSEWTSRKSNAESEQMLLESKVEIINKKRCIHRWGSRYANIIENYIICTKDIGQTMSEICNEKYVDCEDIGYDDDEGRRTDRIPTNLAMHSAYDHFVNNSVNVTARRIEKPRIADGGFCENDHGGPLVYGEGVNAVVLGIISACLVKERSNKCYGPFLYTSIYKNRQFISCAIFKDVEANCRRQFRSGETHTEQTISWKNHPDGPAISEMENPVRDDSIYEPTGVTASQPHVNTTLTRVSNPDKVYANRGYIIRATYEKTNGTVGT